ncbi:hypothetical protein RDWZM_000632 [Blomia tropicalis]|uniref:WASH complex subunit FAM21 n=1 Tax=Blomia tropicalis TaxID=40697 RepID=A0A9Q0MCQ1_BLOTA|nr:hypothetical protein RDWZM_000632 [Blomia tropicalis]
MEQNKMDCSSLNELDASKNKWNLDSDLKLLETIKETTEEIARNIQKQSSNFDDLDYKTSVSGDKVNNLITSVLILTNTKFIENRVYEEDIKEIAPVRTPTSYKNDDASVSEKRIIDNLKNSVTTGINCLNEKYGLNLDDIDSFDKHNLLSSLYIVNNPFINRPLPYLIGSNDFAKDTFVGLKVENIDNPIIVLDNTEKKFNTDYGSTISVSSNSSLNHIDESTSSNHWNDTTSPSLKHETSNHEPKAEIICENDKKITTTKTTLNDAKPTPQKIASIFSSDEDDDIFSVSIVKKDDNFESSKSHIQKAVPFFSSDDEDDDIFEHSKNRNNQSNNQNNSNKEIVESSNVEQHSSTKVVEKLPTNVKDNSLSPKAPFSSSIISELSMAIKKKNIGFGFESDSISSDEDIEEAKIKTKIVVSTPIKSSTHENQIISNVHPIPPSSISSISEHTPNQNDSFNDILKHKAKVNSSRSRKRPTRLSKTYDSPIVFDESNVVSDKDQNSEPTKQPDLNVENSKSPVTTNVKIVESKHLENSKISIFSSSDESDNDIFMPKTLPVVSPDPMNSVTIGEKSEKLTKKPNLFLNSSDDSDSDIFGDSSVNVLKKTTLITTQSPNKETKQIPTNSKNTSTPMNFFDDDSDEAIESIIKTNETSILKKTLNATSLFDDDSDEDLFRS